MSFWLPAVGGALFILAGAWWVSTPLLHRNDPRAREPDRASTILDAGGR